MLVQSIGLGLIGVLYFRLKALGRMNLNDR